MASPQHVCAAQAARTTRQPSLCLLPRASAAHSTDPGVLPTSTGPVPSLHCLGRGRGSSRSKPFCCCQLTTPRAAGNRGETAAVEAARRATLTARCSQNDRAVLPQLRQRQNSLQKPFTDVKESQGQAFTPHLHGSQQHSQQLQGLLYLSPTPRACSCPPGKVRS